tara:strand:- start:72 stop:362 length:291 start_codon:yes stop_codon:yes gene_type:complete
MVSMEDNGAIDSTAPAEGILGCNLTELHKEVDAGWRRFWKKRGFDPPPELYSDKDMWFGRASKLSNYEKVTTEESQQKEAERAAGIQRADFEFFNR